MFITGPGVIQGKLFTNGNTIKFFPRNGFPCAEPPIVNGAKIFAVLIFTQIFAWVIQRAAARPAAGAKIFPFFFFSAEPFIEEGGIGLGHR